jgi:hypothetical protein
MSKQNIELSFEAFKRWTSNIIGLRGYEPEGIWQDLCAEAEKREPLLAYAVRTNDYVFLYDCFDDAKISADKNNSQVIKLQEVNT